MSSLKVFDDRERLAWRETFGTTPQVLQWIERNPPPEGWTSDALDWAYLEMPQIDVGDLRKILDWLVGK